MKSETDLRINPLICNILGCLCEEGRYVPRDLKKAVEYYIKSASVEDPEGLYKIGKCLELNLVNSSELFDQHYASRKEEVRDAIEHYEKAAEKGHLDAMTDLGHIYENGIKARTTKEENSVVSNSSLEEDPQDNSFIIQPNLDFAVKYYHLAKKEQFPRALNNLGALYVRAGNSLPETMKGSNIERGIKYLRRAVEQRYPKAFLNLGKCY
jgi:TPR repeat protein